MKKNFFYVVISFVCILATQNLRAQAYYGEGDAKFQLGPNFQENGTGIVGSYDYGVGPNLSIGVWSSYVLGVDEVLNAGFGDRFDIRARLNANLGNVLADGGDFDIYPGLSLGLKNFGGHVGARYFFSHGFGVYTEFSAPIARYNTDVLSPAEELLNQFIFSFGASFNL